jgi:peptide/nickel transport system substrate-binding protein
MLKVAARVACVLFAFWLSLPAVAQQSTLRVGVGSGDVSTLDPHRASATGDVALVGWFYNGLVRFKPGSANPRDIEPELGRLARPKPAFRQTLAHLGVGYPHLN